MNSSMKASVACESSLWARGAPARRATTACLSFSCSRRASRAGALPAPAVKPERVKGAIPEKGARAPGEAEAGSGVAQMANLQNEGGPCVPWA